MGVARTRPDDALLVWIALGLEGGDHEIPNGVEVFTEKLPTLGDEGDIVLPDFSQYVVGMRKEVTLDKYGHFGFNKDETYFRSILRADGMGRWSGPMKPRNGPNTLSWCVTLAARA